MPSGINCLYAWVYAGINNIIHSRKDVWSCPDHIKNHLGVLTISFEYTKAFEGGMTGLLRKPNRMTCTFWQFFPSKTKQTDPLRLGEGRGITCSRQHFPGEQCHFLPESIGLELTLAPNSVVEAGKTTNLTSLGRKWSSRLCSEVSFPKNKPQEASPRSGKPSSSPITFPL